MSNWSDIAGRANASILGIFGDPVFYFSAGNLGEAGIEISAIRLRRDPSEPNPTGAYEEIEVLESQFTSVPPDGVGIPMPSVGDKVVISGVEYVIAAPLRKPDVDSGTVVLSLARQRQ